MLPIDALAVANYFLDKADADRRKVTHLQLHKILYNAQGYFLARTGECLFPQKIEAWKYGPVIPDVYTVFRDFGRAPITERAMTPSGEAVHADMDGFTKRFLNAIWEGHKDIPPLELAAISHMKGSPWEQVSRGRNLKVHKGIEIPVDMIRDYFSKFTRGWDNSGN